MIICSGLLSFFLARSLACLVSCSLTCLLGFLLAWFLACFLSCFLSSCVLAFFLWDYPHDDTFCGAPHVCIAVADPGGVTGVITPPPPRTCPDPENLCSVCVAGADHPPGVHEWMDGWICMCR